MSWRPSPLEKVASLSPPEAQIMVLPNERRVFVFTAKGTQVFDDALQSLGNVPTTGDTLRAYVVDRPGSVGDEHNPTGFRQKRSQSAR